MSAINSTRPVTSTADVLAAFSSDVKNPLSAPVRDAIVAVLTAIFVAYEDVDEYAAAQADVLRATGIYLDGHGDDRDTQRKSGGAIDAVYRSIILSVQSSVTPAALLAAINSILDQYTTIRSQYYEPILDGWFLQNGTAGFHSFIGAPPLYLDRMYPQDSLLNDGLVRPQSDPGACIPQSSYQLILGSIVTAGRDFVLRVPNIESVQDLHYFVTDGTVPAFSFIGDGTNASGSEASGSVATFIYGNTPTATEIYNSIIEVVTRLKGHGIRWTMIVDDTLR